VITLAAGAALYARREVVKRLGMRLGASLRWGPEWWYDRALDALNLLALGQTRFLQNGYLRHYLVTIIVTTAGLVGYTLVDRAVLDRTVSWSDIRFYEAALAGLILLAALAAARSTSRLGAVAALGGVGFGVALIYLLFGAPDLAMTQFSIETLTVILFVLVFYHLPRFSLLSGRPARVRDALIALSFGALTTALVLLAKTMQLHPAISGYFVEHGVPKAHGRNIVNVILVDFRALDTLGEITVLAVVGIGVFALLKLRPENERTE
jgi:multicomponent Na+:H+ antiporter subunit A